MAKISDVFQVEEVMNGEKKFFQILFDRGDDVDDVINALKDVEGLTLSARWTYPVRMEYRRANGSKGAFTHGALFRLSNDLVYVAHAKARRIVRVYA